MTVKIQEVKTGKELDEFVNFPFELRRSDANWVPPIKKQEKELLDSHPFWETAKKSLYLARDGDAITGRICAIIDEKHNAYAGEKCGAFGFFECVDDQSVASALFNRASGWLAENGMTFMRGPLNPSTNYTCGMLVDGFEYRPSLMMPWNPPYYPVLAENWRMRKERDLFAYHIEKEGMTIEPRLKEEIARLKAENRFAYRVSGKKTLAADIATMLAIYHESWADNWGFSPLSPREADKVVAELSAILDPEFFVLFFCDGKPAAGMVAMPDMNPLLKRLNGKLGLTAPWHYLKSRKDIRKSYRIMLFGILPEYRLRGLPMLLLDFMLEQTRSHPEIEWAEGSWALETNYAIDDLIEDFSGKIKKRYRIYRREIAPCAN
ncbi:MAG: hypothetical protein K2H64_04665 [Desulfovibrio sp.]|nr:hypothetical protein [Desulfovibrio sp.]